MSKNKNVLIFSIQFDPTTNEVLDWLDYYNTSFVRINGDNENGYLGNFTIGSQENDLLIEDKDIEKYHSVWFRKASSNRDLFSENDNPQMVNRLENEIQEFKVSLGNIIERNKYLHKLGSYINDKVDKITQLEAAKSAGLLCPPYIISTQKARILSFAKDYDTLIVKSIYNSAMVGRNSGLWVSHRLFTYDELVDCSDFSHPCIAQAFIRKAYEIRIIYLAGQLYASAIFFENNSVNPDYKDLENRSDILFVPYQLPYALAIKIKKFMKKMNLNVGCIDMIKSLSGDYYFLEVNPNGQFSNISIDCNYFLEQKIALKLSKTR
jgi:hypothetical protein